MGKLRERMKRDMEIRGFSPSTQQAYLHQVKALTCYFGRSPDTLTLEDIQTYQLHLTRERKLASGSLSQTVSALRFFYGVTCSKDWDIGQIPHPKAGRRLPVVLNCHRRWPASRRSTMDRGKARFSFPRANPGPSFSRQTVTQDRVEPGPGTSADHRTGPACSTSRSRPQELGRLFQAAVCRPRTGPALSRTLHPPRRHFQPAPGRPRGQPCDLSLERPGQRQLESMDDTRDRRIPATLSAASRAAGSYAYPALRLVGQPHETKTS